MEIYALAQSMRSGKYTKLQFIIDAILRTHLDEDAREMMVACPATIVNVAGQPDLRYRRVPVPTSTPDIFTYSQIIITERWLTSYNFGDCGWASQRMGNLFRGLLLDVQSQGDIIVLVECHGLNKGQTPQILLVSTIYIDNVPLHNRVLTRIGVESEYDLDSLIAKIDPAILLSAFNIRPLTAPHNVVTIVDQHWPTTPGIIVPRHRLVRASISPIANDGAPMIVLDLSSPITETLAKFMENIFAGGKCNAMRPGYDEMMIYSEIMRALDIHF